MSPTTELPANTIPGGHNPHLIPIALLEDGNCSEFKGLISWQYPGR